MGAAAAVLYLVSPLSIAFYLQFSGPLLVWGSPLLGSPVPLGPGRGDVLCSRLGAVAPS